MRRWPPLRVLSQQAYRMHQVRAESWSGRRPNWPRRPRVDPTCYPQSLAAAGALAARRFAHHSHAESRVHPDSPHADRGSRCPLHLSLGLRIRSCSRSRRKFRIPPGSAALKFPTERRVRSDTPGIRYRLSRPRPFQRRRPSYSHSGWSTLR